MENSVNYLNSNLNRSIDTMTSSLDNSTKWAENGEIVNLVILGLVIYIAFFVGKVYPKGIELLKHPIIKIVAVLYVSHLAQKNVTLALVATVALFTIMLTNYKNTQEFLTQVSLNQNADDNVYEAIMGDCVCRCEGTNCVCRCIEGSEPQDITLDDVDEEMVPEENININHN